MDLEMQFGEQWANKEWLLWKGKNENIIRYKITGTALSKTT